MSNFFNLDNPFFRFMGHVADLIILNCLCLICCIPIVTIGASVTAAYYVALKKVRGEESYIVRSFFQSFKQNFKQATVIWLFFLIFGILMAFDFRIISVMDSTFAAFLRYSLTVIAFFALILFLYVFPVLARFYNTTKNTLKNAVLMAIRHLPYTLVILIVTLGSVCLTFLSDTTFLYGILIWIMIGIALVMLINSYFFRKIFDKYTPVEQESEPEEIPLTPEQESMMAGITPIPKENAQKSEKPSD